MIRPSDTTNERPMSVEKGSVWRRTDPSGSSVEFEVTAIALGPVGVQVATGRTTRGKLIKAQVRQMLTNPRFTFVRGAYAREAGAVTEEGAE